MNETADKKLIILTGPTSVGKTALSISLAKEINGEIISADSMQVYKYMNIGTAKVSFDEMDGVPHHLIDIIEPGENYNAAIFAQSAKKCIDEIYQRGNIPIIVGGTGFYIQAVLYDIDFTLGDEDPEYRTFLENRIISGELSKVYNELKIIDAKAAEHISINDHKRIIRALEFYHTTGVKISDHNKTQSERTSPYNFAYFVLNDIREKIYDNIDCRVDKMVQQGLLEEVIALYNNHLLKGTAAEAIGYKQIIEYLNGNIDLEEAIRLIKRDSRHYAKRQLTWFKKENDVIWIDKFSYNYDNEKILYFIKNILKNKNII